MTELLPDRLFETFFIVMGIMFIAYLLKGVCYYFITVLGHQRMGVYVEADMRHAVFNHMQRLSFSFFDKNRTGVLMSRITTDLFEITELAHHGPEDIIISGPDHSGLAGRDVHHTVEAGAGAGHNAAHIHRLHPLAPR